MLDNSQTPLYFTHSLELHKFQNIDLTGFLTECLKIFSERGNKRFLPYYMPYNLQIIQFLSSEIIYHKESHKNCKQSGLVFIEASN